MSVKQYNAENKQGGQRVEKVKLEKVKLVEIDRVEEQKVEKILNKIKIQGVVKYLVHWKEFIVEHDTQKREEDLENTKKVVAKFERRLNIKVR